MLGEGYVRLVLALAPFVVCLAWMSEGMAPRRLSAALLVAAFFGASLFVPPLFVWGTVPWILLCLLQALVVMRETARGGIHPSWRWVRCAAFLYLPVGGVWALLYQAKLSFLSFPSVIVLLTGVHFHYAGFVLPHLTATLLQERGHGRGLQLCSLGVVLGVPLVAVGITSSQLGLPPTIEFFSVTLLALSAFGVSHGYLAWSGELTGLPKFCFGIAGVALALGMAFALLYGWRSVVPLDWVTIPVMYNLHGSLNSWGFCLPAVLGHLLRGRGGVEVRRPSPK